MNKIERLKKLHKLIKLQEQKVLAEFKEVQKINNTIKGHISDLKEHGEKSNKNNIIHSSTMSEFNIARQFNQKIIIALDELNMRLHENDKQFLVVGDKIKRVRSSLKSIERLNDKHQTLQDYREDIARQNEIEENLNYFSSISK